MANGTSTRKRFVRTATGLVLADQDAPLLPGQFALGGGPAAGTSGRGRGMEIVGESGLSLKVKADRSVPSIIGAPGTQATLSAPGGASLSLGRDVREGTRTIGMSQLESRLTALAEQADVIRQVPEVYRTATQNLRLDDLQKLQASTRISRDQFGGFSPPAGGAIPAAEASKRLEAIGLGADVSTITSPTGQGREQGVSRDFVRNQEKQFAAQERANRTGKPQSQFIGGKHLQFIPRAGEGVQGGREGLTVPKDVAEDYQKILNLPETAEYSKQRKRVVAWAQHLAQAQERLTKARAEGDDDPEGLEEFAGVTEKHLQTQREKLVNMRRNLTPEQRETVTFFEDGIAPESREGDLARVQPGFKFQGPQARAAKAATAAKGKVPRAKRINTLQRKIKGLKGSTNIDAAMAVYEIISKTKDASLIGQFSQVQAVLDQIAMNPNTDIRTAVMESFGIKATKGSPGFTLNTATGQAGLAIGGYGLPINPKADKANTPFASLEDMSSKEQKEWREKGGLAYNDARRLEDFRKPRDVDDGPARRRSLIDRWHRFRKKMTAAKVNKDTTRRAWQVMVIGQTKEVQADWEKVRKKLGIKAPRVLRQPKAPVGDSMQPVIRRGTPTERLGFRTPPAGGAAGTLSRIEALKAERARRVGAR